ncbi:MAG: hypothetical protein ACRDD1_16250, partial [Planctomycetia bacterium]
ARADLRERTGADFVDCETAAVVRVCARASIGVAVLRVVSDEVDGDVPPALMGLLRSDGEVDLLRAAFTFLARPGLLSAASRLRKDSATAAAALQTELRRMRDGFHAKGPQPSGNGNVPPPSSL